MNNRPYVKKVKCEFCDDDHEELEIYVKRVAHLEPIKEVKLVECKLTGNRYLVVNELQYVLN